MEIIDDRRVTTPRAKARSATGKIYMGAILVAAGIVWLLYNYKLLSEGFIDVVISWQMMVLLCGGFLLAVRQWTVGAVLAIVGFVFMVLDLLSIHVAIGKIILPAAVIAVGVSLLVQRKS